MRVSLRHGLLAAWALWVIWVALHYFTVPTPIPDAPSVARYRDFVDLLDRSLTPMPFWTEALGRASWAAMGASIVLLAGWGLGGAAVSAFTDILTNRTERFLVRLALGLALVSWLCLALAMAQIYRPAPLVTVLVIASAFGARSAIRGASYVGHEKYVGPTFRSGNNAPSYVGPTFRSGNGAAIFTFVALLALGFALVGALAPETEFDALWYHLWIPHEWLKAGRPVDRVDEYISLYPQYWELLYGAAMSIGGPIAAKLLHFACLPLTAATAALLARRLSPTASAPLSVALTACTPILLWEATTAYNDLALAWYVALATYAAIRFHDSTDRRWLFLCAAFFGVALSIKHLGLVALAVACVMLFIVRLAERPRHLRRGFTTSAAVAAIALLPALPWYTRALIRSGNPVFPDLYTVFGARPADRWGPEAQQALQAFKDHFGGEQTIRSIALLPWTATVHAERFGGTLGPAFLMLVPLALLLPSASRRRVWTIAAACGLYILVWASPLSSLQMRFLVPLVPLFAAIAAAGVAGLKSEDSSDLAMRRGVYMVVGVLLVMNLPPFIRWHERDRAGWSGWLTHVMRVTPAPVVIGAESEAAYLGRTVRSYNAWTFIGNHLPADARVLAFTGGDHLYATRGRLSADATMARAMTWGSLAGQESAVLRDATRLHVTHVLIDKRSDVSRLAVASERMRACCLATLYEDADTALYRLKADAMPPDGTEGTDAARSSAAP